MSVSFWLIRVSPELVSINDLNEANILEIGTKSEIISRISELFPEVSSHEGYYYLPGCRRENSSNSSIWEVWLGDDEPVKLICIKPHVGMCDLTILQDISQQLKCSIFDPQDGGFIFQP
ncbi:hypothetical protein I8748_18875 [Nostoc sp. CENA67]|uniref:Uncharacterized protein n=1 Tax=Amazonocrinis nigriterrae CENA67 TaxID=2794033 RepID=A0A8J7HU66_9NOST|nr:hypothetical protein [Amazonocrinis nigriterrae]MBH8564225.1 hypothetical protein [Amazonocrinis nigriterrae CENA67]